MILRKLVPFSLVILLALFAGTSQDVSTGNAQANSPAPTKMNAPLGSAFTYQGQLKDSTGNPITASCDFRFILYDAEFGGAQVGPLQGLTGVSVANGYFTVLLDFGSAAFTGDARWLEVSVRCSGEASYTMLSPRQALTPAPYASYAPNAGAAVTAGSADTASYADTAGAASTADSAGSAPWSGLTGVPAGFADNTDNDTTYTAGNGLTLSGTQFSLNFGGSGSAATASHSDHDHFGQTWSGSGTGLTLSGGDTGLSGSGYTYGLYGHASTASGTTYGVYGQSDSPDGWAGYFFTQAGAGVGINAPPGGMALDVQQGQVQVAEGISYPDGVLQTEGFYRPRLPGPGSANTVDSSVGVGYYTSLTIGADGLGLISYLDATNYDLKVLHCGNTACNSGNTITTLDSSGSVGYDTSLTIGADGLGLISYLDATNGDLKVLHCGNPACNSWNTITPVDSSGIVGYNTSLTIGADGLGLISYLDWTNQALKVLHCGNTACDSGNTITTVDSSAIIGYSTSLTIGADGLGLISYLDWTNGDLKVLHCGNPACNSGNTMFTPDSTGNVGDYTSITIGADGLGLISYYDYTNGDLKVLHCGNTACDSGNTITTVDSSGIVGYTTSLTIGADGLGLISYFDATNYDLKVLHCGNITCDSGNTITTLDSSGSVGQFTSLTIGADGLGLISYRDITNQYLKVFKCSNLACEAYVRVGR